jgi:hypothetical protein
VTILVSKDQVIIPQIEKEKICEDLNTAIFLGDKRKMINEAIAKYCLVNNK